jgi:hypothetical protein
LIGGEIKDRGCQWVRSRELRILVVENFVLKKKRECEREEEEWGSHEEV